MCISLCYQVLQVNKSTRLLLFQMCQEKKQKMIKNDVASVSVKGPMASIYSKAVVVIEIWVLLSKGEVSEWPWLFLSTVSNCEAVLQQSGTIKAVATVRKRDSFYVN